MEKQTRAVIVSFDNQHGDDRAVLIVGEKKQGMDVDIINTIQGPEAIELWKRLITQKTNKK